MADHWWRSRTAERVPLVIARPQKARRLLSPTRGAYVPIPAEYRSRRAVPASHFIEPMMRYLNHDYYVAYLSAAEIHGGAHRMAARRSRRRNRLRRRSCAARRSSTCAPQADASLLSDSGLPIEELADQLGHRRYSHGEPPLAAAGRRAGPFNERWNILVNTDVESDL